MEYKLTPNSLMILALSNEYCQAMESVSAMTKRELVEKMVRMLPRLYIAVSDVNSDEFDFAEDVDIQQALEEEYYNEVSLSVGRIMGEDDTYLEVFESDMKYSDTPIAATISEGLADIFQVLYNFVETVRDAQAEIVGGAIAALKDDFDNYWSQTLCNTLRPLNHIIHNLED